MIYLVKNRIARFLSVNNTKTKYLRIVTGLVMISFLTLYHQVVAQVAYPSKGYFMLLGGGITPKQAALFLKFSSKVGKKVIIVPTAFSDKKINKDPTFNRVKRRFQRLGITNVEILHTRNRQQANDLQFIQGLKKAGGVFFLGGKTSRIADAYTNTQVHQALINLLKRGGIIAGVSAGSGVQANYFFNQHFKKGFSFLPDVIIMNHFFSHNKQFTHIQEIKNKRNYLAIGIDDNTGIFIKNGLFEVIGKSYVAIYDGTNYIRQKDLIQPLPHYSERFYVLRNGDRYNLRKRQVVSNKSLTPLPMRPTLLKEYEGKYKSISNSYSMTCQVQKDTLYLHNSWGWKPYPIFPYKKDIFFAKNRMMWFRFIRGPGTQQIIGAQKMKSILQEEVIVEMKKAKTND